MGGSKSCLLVSYGLVFLQDCNENMRFNCFNLGICCNLSTDLGFDFVIGVRFRFPSFDFTLLRSIVFIFVSL